MSSDPQSTPEFTDAEHDEIMRLHIVEGHTISGAMLVVWGKRLAASQEPLGEEFEKVLSDNLEALYVRS